MVGPTTPILCKTMLSPYVRAVHSLKVLLTLTKEPFVSATTSDYMQIADILSFEISIVTKAFSSAPVRLIC
jgi:uncharacterized protein YueI